ncbi:DinB family protein [Bacillus sp. H-16]|uniref:DinB family protein n=1 Tax=Alteribacter salitolerans TaxID=2912333 RepID=UPI0019648D77|nr:DinB family protein [Alteribacter salitolerans]MBM7095072.1 DinB family protein [Alteribacter salitolerans]
MIDYRIVPKVNYTEKIGVLVSMLEHTRAVTLNEIAGLTQHQLDHIPGENTNSIGSLLLHIASIEFVHQIVSFEKRDLTENEYALWRTPLELGAAARNKIKNNPPEYYLKKLSNVRDETLARLKTKDDRWLFEDNKWENGVAYNNYYLWFHVLEDEISHRGQIRTIKKQV